ncbi:MAG TPA: acyltransferase domain-containing protein [Friedmanniella sp.]
MSTVSGSSSVLLALTTDDVRRRLADGVRPENLERLGFRAEDATDVAAAAASAVGRDDDLATITAMAARIGGRLGRLETANDGGGEVWVGLPSAPPGGNAGELCVLALVATAPDVAAFHAGRGIPADVSWATLSDLGQQVWVNRLTQGAFGLRTEWWLSLVWSGALYRLGRLQFDLEPAQDDPDAWVLNTHIPRGGSLVPALVDDALAQAAAFFPAHFPDHPVREVVCHSWMLDPALGVDLPGSNLASFQQRWDPYGPVAPGDGDVLFFVFLEPGPVDVATLPTDTRLRRAAVARMTSGRPWSVVSGRLRGAAAARAAPSARPEEVGLEPVGVPAVLGETEQDGPA